jgi:hypothetical protein
MQLGKDANQQGSESNDGASYEDEQGWDNEALRRDEDKEKGIAFARDEDSEKE